MAINAHTYRYDEMEEGNNLQTLLRTLANTHIPSPPDAPTLLAKTQNPKHYVFLLNGNPGTRRVVIKPRDYGVRVELDVDDDLPDEFCQSVVARAALEVLRANKWDESPLQPFKSEVFDYETLKADNLFQALKALDRKMASRLKKLPSGSYERPQDRSALPDEDWLYSPKNIEVTTGSNWAHLHIWGSEACSKITLYFHRNPDTLRLDIEGKAIERPAAQGWILDCIRDLITVCLDAWYYNPIYDDRTGIEYPGVHYKTGITLN